MNKMKKLEYDYNPTRRRRRRTQQQQQQQQQQQRRPPSQSNQASSARRFAFACAFKLQHPTKASKQPNPTLNSLFMHTQSKALTLGDCTLNNYTKGRLYRITCSFDVQCSVDAVAFLSLTTSQNSRMGSRCKICFEIATAQLALYVYVYLSTDGGGGGGYLSSSICRVTDSTDSGLVRGLALQLGS